MKLWGSEKKAVYSALETLHTEGTIIRLEIEKLGVRFKTTLALRKGVVAIAKPLGFRMSIPKGTWVRFKTPEKEGKEIRLEIADPDFTLPNGKGYFICAVPESFAENAQRQQERFHTSRFKNLHIFFPDLKSDYRIMDLSLSGCKIDTGKENLGAVWNEGEEIAPVEIKVSTSISIPLEAVIPRLITDGTVGLEFTFPEGVRAEEHLAKLVNWIENWENKQSKVMAEIMQRTL